MWTSEGIVKQALAQRKNDPSTLIRELSQQERYTGFVPDAGAYEQSIQAQIAELLGQIPAGVEAFNADVASRGLFSAGEAPKNLYSNVFAPIARAGATAVAQGNLGLAQAQQQGYIAQHNARLQAVQLWLQQTLGEKQMKMQKDAQRDSMLGDIFGAGVGALTLL